MLQRVFGSEYKELVNVIQPLLNQVRPAALAWHGALRGCQQPPRPAAPHASPRARPQHKIQISKAGASYKYRLLSSDELNAQEKIKGLKCVRSRRRPRAASPIVARFPRAATRSAWCTKPSSARAVAASGRGT